MSASLGIIRGDYDSFVHAAHARWQQAVQRIEHADRDPL